MILPLPPYACVRLFEHLPTADSNALVRAYPGLVHACAQTRYWQARLPVEIAQIAFAHLRPADSYAACCVCAFWRGCRMNARMLKAQLDLAVSRNSPISSELAVMRADATAEEIWRYFVVAAPRGMVRKGYRGHRVVSLDLRRPVARRLANSHQGSGIFLSDYGRIVAVSAVRGLIFYAIEDMLAQADWSHYDQPFPNVSQSGLPEAVCTLQHPKGGNESHSQLTLRDVGIAHQQGSAGRGILHLFALYDGGKVFCATMQLREMHSEKRFTSSALVYAGPPSISTVDCDWSCFPPPVSFDARHIDAIVPPVPARATITPRAAASNEHSQAYVARVRMDFAPGQESVRARAASIDSGCLASQSPYNMAVYQQMLSQSMVMPQLPYGAHPHPQIMFPQFHSHGTAARTSTGRVSTPNSTQKRAAPYTKRVRDWREAPKPKNTASTKKQRAPKKKQRNCPPQLWPATMAFPTEPPEAYDALMRAMGYNTPGLMTVAYP